MKRKKIALLFFIVSFFTSIVHAGSSCTFKVINHYPVNFSKLNASASIGNLLIPLCSKNPMRDPVTLKNCASDPDNTLFEYPQEEPTCVSTNHQPVLLYLWAVSKYCRSVSQVTVKSNVVLSFPEDFVCRKM
ncbi:MAG TPA: hypothetical protein VLJ15_02695 [Gammaproteobacteria bacterium]|nr:hypothetical protein [Gammaproteobacteria bacterium]